MHWEYEWYINVYLWFIFLYKFSLITIFQNLLIIWDVIHYLFIESLRIDKQKAYIYNFLLLNHQLKYTFSFSDEFKWYSEIYLVKTVEFKH
jgi:hypothetical protein